jgi:hypothetical protein
MPRLCGCSREIGAETLKRDAGNRQVLPRQKERSSSAAVSSANFFQVLQVSKILERLSQSSKGVIGQRGGFSTRATARLSLAQSSDAWPDLARMVQGIPVQWGAAELFVCAKKGMPVLQVTVSIAFILK